MEVVIAHLSTVKAGRLSRTLGAELRIVSCSTLHTGWKADRSELRVLPCKLTLAPSPADRQEMRRQLCRSQLSWSLITVSWAVRFRSSSQSSLARARPRLNVAVRSRKLLVSAAQADFSELCTLPRELISDICEHGRVSYKDFQLLADLQTYYV